MSEYTPGLAKIREHYVWMHGDPSKGDAGERFDREIAEVERAAAARAVQHVRKEIRGIPHWWNTEEQRGGFDIPPLGPNASSEEGAFMEVMRVLDECAAEYRKEQ